jgi:hypothetical protein
MIKPADWERMSWHARERFLRRQRNGGVRPVVEVASQAEPVVSKPAVRVRLVPRFRRDDVITRCSECGAWMMDTCGTDHVRRYEL